MGPWPGFRSGGHGGVGQWGVRTSARGDMFGVAMVEGHLAMAGQDTARVTQDSHPDTSEQVGWPLGQILDCGGP